MKQSKVMMLNQRDDESGRLKVELKRKLGEQGYEC